MSLNRNFFKINKCINWNFRKIDETACLHWHWSMSYKTTLLQMRNIKQRTTIIWNIEHNMLSSLLTPHALQKKSIVFWCTIFDVKYNNNFQFTHCYSNIHMKRYIYRENYMFSNLPYYSMKANVLKKNHIDTTRYSNIFMSITRCSCPVKMTCWNVLFGSTAYKIVNPRHFFWFSKFVICIKFCSSEKESYIIRFVMITLDEYVIKIRFCYWLTTILRHSKINFYLKLNYHILDDTCFHN